MKTITSDNNTLLINYLNDIKYNLTELTRSDCGQQQTVVVSGFVIFAHASYSSCFGL